MKRTSSRNGSGSRTTSRRGLSVVPRMSLPSQGTANSTRPSAVLGTIKAWSDGKNSRSTTMCTPWLGATMGLMGRPMDFRRPSGAGCPPHARWR